LLNEILTSLIACPRCQGPLDQRETDLHCSSCRAAFAVRDGIPRMSTEAERADERMAAEWEAQAHAHALYIDPAFIMNSWEKAVLPRLFDWIGAIDGPVLDAGCGIGKLGTALTNRGRNGASKSAPIVGFDFQGTLLAEAGPGYEALVEADVHHLPFKSQSFAAAIASNSLHHFPDANQAMRELARVLRPGGVLVTYDPRFLEPLEAVKKMLRKNDDAFTKDHKAFRVDEYRDLLGSSGLHVDEVRTVDPLGPLLATAFDYLKVGRLGVAPQIADRLAALDDFICGADGRTAAGLMLAGRAVKA
jgi:SAM-dependent methyltransferase